mmetsp:Transcript_43545/g.132520  ORF Transcript_43545/g.132520 Transcript_43545/m.132520 type:complete len:673 (-) Transcript_43545:3-2021(-)
MVLCVYLLFQTAGTGEILSENVERMRAGEKMRAKALERVPGGGRHAASKYGSIGGENDDEEGDAFDGAAGSDLVRREVDRRGADGASGGVGVGVSDTGSLRKASGVKNALATDEDDAASRLQKALANRQRKRRQKEKGGGGGYGLVGVGVMKDGRASYGGGGAREEVEGDRWNDPDDDLTCTPLPKLHDPLPSHHAGYLDYQRGFVTRNQNANDAFLSLDRLKCNADPKCENDKGRLPRYVTLEGGSGERAAGAHFAFGDFPLNDKGEVMTTHPAGYAWNGTGAVVGAEDDGSGFVPPTEEIMDFASSSADDAKAKAKAKHGNEGNKWKRHLHLEGDHVAHLMWFAGNYGHFIHDGLPIIAWLRENLPPRTKLLLRHHPRDENTLRTVDPAFVEERVVWLKGGEDVATIRDGSLGVLVMRVPGRNGRSVRSLRRWLAERHRAKRKEVEAAEGSGAKKKKKKTPKKRSVIYHTRSGSKDTLHGRVVDAAHEANIIALIKRKMARYGLDRDHELIIFSGQEGGTTMTVPRQMEVFGAATSMIGPHGSGLANTVWMMGWDDRDADETKADKAKAKADGDGDKPLVCPAAWGGPDNVPTHRPQVLEYLLGPSSTHVQDDSPTPYTRTHYHIYSTAMWAEWHHVLYSGNSTNGRTFVNLDAVGEALDDMWGGGRFGR